MARTDTLGNFLTDVADAIRTKKGTTEAIVASDFDTEISNLPSGTGEAPAIGMTIDKWSTNGQAEEITIYGMTEIPAYYLGARASTVSQNNSINMVKKITIPDDVTQIGDTAFGGKRWLTTINLPETITSIGSYAFYQNMALELSSLPSSVTKLGTYTFADCTKLSFETLPDGITEIPNYCFSGCTAITPKSLPAGLTSLGSYAFNNCKNLALTTIPDGITSIPTYCFYGCTAMPLSSLPDTITKIEARGFENCKELCITKLPDSLTTLGNSAFLYCDKMNITELPSGLTRIPDNCFGQCTGLTIKTLPNSVIEIASWGFSKCTGLIQLSMNNVTTMSGSYTSNSSFNGCSSLKALWIGSAITNLPAYMVYDRDYLSQAAASLIKIYIDKPRATVEGFAGYQYAFCGSRKTTDIVICNDDEDWLTKEEFDAIDWATYTETEEA